VFPLISYDLYGVAKSEFMDFIRGDFKRCTTGEYELLEILPAYLERWNVAVTPEVFVRQWVEHEHHVDAELLARIQEIRTRGIPCYLGTNQERNRANYLKLEMNFANVFDAVYAASDLGVRKPNNHFYAKVQQAIQIRAEQILFWDDSLENVLAARDAGWNAEVFTRLEDFDASMNRYGF
jgi:putative hydrolase of the HAD superfamily